MGTRSLTFVYDESGTAFVNMYRQYDGYMSGHGAELAEFLNSFDALVNGIPVGDTRKMANGMGCLAAQMVSHFKGNEAGQFYLYAVDEISCGQEYEYHIFSDHVMVNDYDGDVVFNGTWKEFYEATHEKATA